MHTFQSPRLPSLPEKTAVWGFFLLIIGLRAPEILISPRFWAEEGVLYFKYAYENSFLDGLLMVIGAGAGYLSLLVNIPITVAAHWLPLEYAPTVTTWFSLWVMLIPLWLILTGRSVLWDSPEKRYLALALIYLAPTSAMPEIWLNTINLQVYAGIISLSLLFEVPAQTRSRLWTYRSLLLLCGLTGPYTVFLSPVFFMKALLERSREAFWQLGIVGLASTIQFSLFLYIKYSGALSGMKLGYFEIFKSAVYVVYYHVLTPLVGLEFLSTVAQKTLGVTAIQQAYQAQGVWAGLSAPGILSLLLLVGLMVALWRLKPTRTQALLLLAYACTSWLTTYGAIHGVPHNRYAVVAGLCLLLAMLNIVTWPVKRWSSGLVAGLLGFALFQGVLHYQSHPIFLRYVQGNPRWANEVTAWRHDPQHQLRVWPAPKWGFYLSDPQLLQQTRSALAASGEFTLHTSGADWAERRIAVTGLPTDFFLRFTVHSDQALSHYQGGVTLLDAQDQVCLRYPWSALSEKSAQESPETPFYLASLPEDWPIPPPYPQVVKPLGARTCDLRQITQIRWRLKTVDGSAARVQVQQLTALPRQYYSVLHR